jgi:hypothetical protein
MPAMMFWIMATPGCTSYREADFTLADGICTSAIQQTSSYRRGKAPVYTSTRHEVEEESEEVRGFKNRREAEAAGEGGRSCAGFAALRTLLQPYQGELVPQTDQPDYFCLESKTATYRNRPMYFAGVRRGKNYVSYFLMTVPACPELVRKMSPGLKKRMQGKACFNFTSVAPEIFVELARLTQAGFEKFKSLKYL